MPSSMGAGVLGVNWEHFEKDVCGAASLAGDIWGVTTRPIITGGSCNTHISDFVSAGFLSSISPLSQTRRLKMGSRVRIRAGFSHVLFKWTPQQLRFWIYCQCAYWKMNVSTPITVLSCLHSQKYYHQTHLWSKILKRLEISGVRDMKRHRKEISHLKNVCPNADGGFYALE